MKYLIRSIKYLVFIVIMFTLTITIFFYLSPNKQEDLTILDMFQHNSNQLVIFFVAFSAIYPLIGYGKKQIFVSNFVQNKEAIIEIFTNANFVIDKQTDTLLVFKLKNPLMRLLRTFEDRVTIDFSENPVLIEGLRKDVFRFSRGIEYACREVENE